MKLPYCRGQHPHLSCQDSLGVRRRGNRGRYSSRPDTGTGRCGSTEVDRSEVRLNHRRNLIGRRTSTI